MKKFLFFLLIVLVAMSLTGCFYMEPVKIAIPYDPTALRSPDSTVWRPDPTRVIFRNQSVSIHMNIWVGRVAAGQPDVELAPEESRPFNFPGVGKQIIYISGREATASGWRNLGTKKRPIEISSFSPFGGIREISVGNGDFYVYHDYYYQSLNFWRW